MKNLISILNLIIDGMTKYKEIEYFLRKHCNIVLDHNGEEIINSSLNSVLIAFDEYKDAERAKLLNCENDFDDFGFGDSGGIFEGDGISWKCDKDHPENCV